MIKKVPLLFLFLLFTIPPIRTDEAKDEGGIFRWAFVTIDPTGKVSSINPEKPVKKDMLKKRIKIFIQPIKNAYIYLFILDPDKNLTLLFPGEFKNMKKQSTLFTKYVIPEDGRFDGFLKKPGTHQLYFLVSTKRLHGLEKAIAGYLKNSSQDNGEKKNRSRIDMLDRISIVMGDSLLGGEVTKKPVPIIGTVRNEERQIDEEAFEYTFKNIYSKIITISNE